MEKILKIIEENADLAESAYDMLSQKDPVCFLFSSLEQLRCGRLYSEIIEVKKSERNVLLRLKTKKGEEKIVFQKKNAFASLPVSEKDFIASLEESTEVEIDEYLRILIFPKEKVFIHFDGLEKNNREKIVKIFNIGLRFEILIISDKIMDVSETE